MGHRLILVSISAVLSLVASWSAGRGLKVRRSRKARDFYGVYPSKRPRLFIVMVIANLFVALMLWLGTMIAAMRLVAEF